MPSRDKRRADIARFLKVYRDFGAPAAPPGEQALWIILARHGSEEGASRALRALWRRFVDINEVRVGKGTEIATVIQRHVKNDPYRVAEQLRGWLRRFHKDHHKTDLAVTESMTAEQLRRYLAHAEAFVPEMALALFLHYCARETAREAELVDDEGKARKRPEKEVTLAAERLRMLAATAARGGVVAKTKQALAGRGLAKAWTYRPLPVPNAPTSARAQDEAAKRASPAATRGGGTARPRTTRATRTRRVKKSSRR
ncbi:MAG: hypothetical protein ACYTEZ_16015 [Planctomycetota bacterium]